MLQNTGNKNLLILAYPLFAIILIGYIFITYQNLLIPMVRGGSEAYDFNNGARNLVYSNPAAISYLMDQRMQDPEHLELPNVYLHAPNSHRFIGAIFIWCGLTSATSVLMASAILFAVAFVIATYFWSKSFGTGLLSGILYISFILADQYSSTMMLDPFRSIQYGLFILTLFLISKDSKDTTTKKSMLFTGISFFLIWQIELVFAAFCSVFYAISILWMFKGSIRERFQRLLSAITGSIVSIGLFIIQLYCFTKGWSFLQDWLDVSVTRNTELYSMRYVKPEALANKELLDMFSPLGTPGHYQIPKNIFDFIRHIMFMLLGRFNFYYIIPIVLLTTFLGVIASSKSFFKKTYPARLSPQLNGFIWPEIQQLGVVFIAFFISLILLGVPFRGYISYLYLMMFYPLIEMWVALGLVLATLLILHWLLTIGPQKLAITGTSFLVITFGGILYLTSNSRWETNVGMATAITPTMVKTLSRKPFYGSKLATSFQDPWVFTGIIGKPSVYISPENILTTPLPTGIQYYVCSQNPACTTIEKLFKNQIVFKEGENFIVDLKQKPQTT